MRKILFRGKRVDNGEWVEGDLLREKDVFGRLHTCIYQVKGNNMGAKIEVDPATVGQFTGLLDKNGKKIFEGDIVKTKFGRLCIIVWFSSSSHSGYDMAPVETADNCLHTRKPDLADLYYSDNLEIKGKIHDNPELLKGE